MFHCDSKLPEDSNSGGDFSGHPNHRNRPVGSKKIMGFFQLKQPSSDWATSLWKASFRIIQYHPKNIKNSRWEW